VAPAAGATEANPAAQPDPNAPPAAENPAGGTTAAGTADVAFKTDATPVAGGQNSDTAKADSSATPDGPQDGTNGGSKKESTSKKKKGLKKIVPW
jgi:hypothetical protein